VRELGARQDVDPRRIVIIGASFGTPVAIEAAAREPAIDGLIVVHGFARVRETAEHVILRSWLPRYGWFARPAAWFLTRLASLYLDIPEPEESARRLRARQKALLVSAEEDSFIPKASREALWEALESSGSGAAREHVVMKGDHLMPGSDEKIRAIMAISQDWLARQDWAD
jgi:pimeloyl-ACP methyl ester carboxylesterase